MTQTDKEKAGRSDASKEEVLRLKYRTWHRRARLHDVTMTGRYSTERDLLDIAKFLVLNILLNTHTQEHVEKQKKK